VLVRFRCKCNMAFPDGASNQGIGIRLIVLLRLNGVSEDPHIMYDSNPEGTTSDTVWYRETHGDVREVTRVIQMPEEVIGGTHVVVQIYTRGTGGSADIYPRMQMRNLYARSFTTKFGATTVSDGAGEGQFARNSANDLYGEGRIITTRMKQFAESKATIQKGRPITVSARIYIDEAEVRQGPTGQTARFVFGIGVEFKRRIGNAFDWVTASTGTGDASATQGFQIIGDHPLLVTESFVAQHDYTHIRSFRVFVPFTPNRKGSCSITQSGFSTIVMVDDSVDSS